MNNKGTSTLQVASNSALCDWTAVKHISLSVIYILIDSLLECHISNTYIMYRFTKMNMQPVYIDLRDTIVLQFLKTRIS